MISEETERPEGFPELAWDGFKRYVLHGIRPGQTLAAFFRGDLFEVYRRGDREFLDGLEAMVRYVSGPCPQGCYGSESAYQRWLESGGLRGIEGS